MNDRSRRTLNPEKRPPPWQAVVTGGSAGSMEALEAILTRLPAAFPLPVLCVQHMHPSGTDFLARHLDDRCRLAIREACDKEPVRPGHVYMAPPDYHLLVERDETLALSVDEKVNYSRPSIDVLFESAAQVWGSRLVAVVLSGSNHDGAAGARCIREGGGLVVAQDPETAEQPAMPRAAMQAADSEVVLSPDRIADLLLEISGMGEGDGDMPTALREEDGHG